MIVFVTLDGKVGPLLSLLRAEKMNYDIDRGILYTEYLGSELLYQSIVV